MGGANGDRVSFLEWGVSVGTLPGQERSGDAYVVRRHPDGGATVAVVDGLGHGPDAAAAAARAAAILADGSPQSVIGMARRCHDALARTRGAVMNIATFSTADDTMSWLGIGNVEGVLMRSDPAARPRIESILARSGVVGLRMPLLRASVTTVAAGDFLVFATDGVRPEFTERLASEMSAQHLADAILKEYGRRDDDALVLVARYLGAPKRSS